VSFITWFADTDSVDVATIGGKGANLCELTRAGFEVPPGFVLRTDAYWQLLTESALRPVLEERLKRASADRDGQAAASIDIKALIEGTSVPAGIISDVDSAIRQLGTGPFAVRSSATAEDMADASFAGQQATLLNVRVGDVAEAIRACWASLFEPQAMAYRDVRGISHVETAIAVVVQEMVQSARSGVMFTVHPVTGDRDKLIIEAAYGLGEAVVSGIVTPDTYVVDKPSLAIEERDVNRQDRKLVLNSESGGDEPNKWVELAAHESSGQKLADAEIAELADLGMRIEGHYSSPQDIEWAELHGAFFVLQARPVTAGF
jgi:pyruvate,water dikinase